ncbi:hypothetical protein [Chitinophaga barathri]|uniref:Uncharacterized protein n=1 Tax=Chitinophaga barathri TaxID=1647451 RepID=A0A3N4M9T0_9BACT|nr:hypothetical protein [Chitinophaga barathri]RPD38406.1 hypothetical protein EG028_24350 [Chitinophaga barathri]
MAKVKVKDLAMLEQEITRLQQKSRRLEDQLGNRIDHFKGNYKKMAVNSVVPGIANSGAMGFLGGMAKTLWQSGSAKSMLTKAALTALEFVAVRFGIKLFNNFKSKRHRRKAEARAQADPEE